ncbi:hypothetical protein L210DRAFT_2785803 [Boletus edulis BED1]|uniref:Transmembrane protein n=1 Tax=Boletus edulis BED1 TaxID=1328754 RepID=A0AAD4GJ64_BOLED|nr:hypothetical protein L210DRAFT_2785803 [Boletus edulis BED1]
MTLTTGSTLKRSPVALNVTTAKNCVSTNSVRISPMIHLSRSGQVGVYFVLFAGFALATLRNVTVDDAVVPQYLPTNSVWNIGGDCTTCLVKPDPTLAYNGTWHDSTFAPSNGYTQAIEFTFTGNALYIFFITANNVTGATTFTDLDFVLDQVTVGRYTHTPSSSTDYQYNVPVYVNESMDLGAHNMMIQPVNSGNQVLMLFDYFIYTMDASVSVSSSASPSSTSSPLPTTSGTATSSRPNNGAIVGGVVGGVAAVVLVVTSLLCYRRHKKRNGGQPPNSPIEGWAPPVVEPFILSHEVAQAPLAGTTPSMYPDTLMGFLATEPTSRSKTDVSSTAPRPSIPYTSTTAFSSPVPPSSGNNDALMERVELLRDEVARLRDLHDTDQYPLAFQSEAPPEYS